MSGIAAGNVLQLTATTPAPFPDRAVVKMLTTAYFDQVHPQFPFLHKPTYRRWEEEVLTAGECKRSPDPVHAFFVLALCAVGALTGPFAGNTLPEGLYAAAETYYEHVIQQNSLESIQAILACAMYSLRSPVGVSVWMLSGLALRQCLEFGLHRKIRWSRAQPDYVKEELRKRVFWCSYNLDRAVAVTLGRPVGIADHDIDAELPSDINDEDITPHKLLRMPRSSHAEPATEISSAIHTIRLRQLWARMQRVVYPQVESGDTSQSDQAIQEFKTEFGLWLEHSPEQLLSNRLHNDTFGSPEWYKLMYNHSILLLYRHKLVRKASGSVTAQVFVDCAQSSHAICMIYKQLYVTQRLNDTWGALHVLFLAAVTYLHCVLSSDEVRGIYRLNHISSTCTSIMVVLAIMAERWKPVESYRDAFEMLSNATQATLIETSMAQRTPAGPLISPEGQKQFTDYLSYMAEIGMCASVEDLLTDMVE
ncbi:hypothetical protein LTR56_015924 [Elasticomyces elasticus]|nr:hypothetical protein LTR56_015924 [Elasticomyces elasticus]KAK3655319.1 hypothetical protein LTR22_010349 [Elasticomyces elasticus]KAK4918675.1 hypothetical protein LTR49_013600 [Elasticomyces elasticus]KAK5751967.1 hypothetical protein LTS12_017983 [Elasticomyces elasticus]